MKKINRLAIIPGVLLSSALLCGNATATIVQFQTNLGNFNVNLYDKGTPKTVENFLQYVNDSAFDHVIIHRAVNSFVIQGGGFTYSDSWPPVAISANPAVNNEPVYSNVRGTIAMAKLSGDANSATNQWFFNLSNNSQNLDFQNGGFTVFGEVVDDGMSIVDQIAQLPTYNLSGSNAAFGQIPLQNYSGGDPEYANLAVIDSVQIIDSSPDSADGLNPPASLASQTPPEDDNSSSGGGALSWLMLGSIILLNARSRRK